MSAALSALLRERTTAAHTRAETTPFLLALAEGRVTRVGVVGLLQRLVPVYAALEQLAPAWAADPGVEALLVPGLQRSARLHADLDRLGAASAAFSPAASAYAERIRSAAADDAPCFVAHHYTRYLGDLSGGQVVAAALRRSLDLDLDFLAFPGLRAPVVKRAYRSALDALPWTAAEQERAVAEADRAFAFNAELAGELAGQVLPQTQSPP